MTFSLNEAEATARKAARGAGYTWGMADEAGKAVRWLYANGIDGCGAMAALLQGVDGRDFGPLAPDVTTVDWTAQGAFLCPIMAGCAFADGPRDRVNMQAVMQPVLLLPFLAATAQSKSINIQVLCDGGRAATDGARVCLDGVLPRQSGVVIQQSADFATLNRQVTRATPDPDDWAILHAFAHRTYAPATDESRLKGAG